MTGKSMAQVRASLYPAMMKGGLSLHLVNMDAKEMETIAMAMARKALEFALIAFTKLTAMASWCHD
jgi:hypothetical protein